MPGWMMRVALMFLTLLSAVFAGGAVLGAASAETHVAELLVTCLACGEQWIYVPSSTLGAGLLSLFRRRTLADRCPKCRSRAVAFSHADEAVKRRQGRTA